MLLIGKTASGGDFGDARRGLDQPALSVLDPPLHYVMMRRLADRRSELAGKMRWAKTGSIGDLRQADMPIEVGLDEINGPLEPLARHRWSCSGDLVCR